jgi:RNA 2',3'-cyclic 3'-phosphodiesterase
MSDRLFFALWPDDATRAELARRLPDWADGIDGRLQRPDQWHVTLEFIGEVPPERHDDLLGAARCVPVRSLEIGFDVLEHWRKPQVACLAATHTPDAIAELVARLRGALARVGFSPEGRPFRAHVTLARKVRSLRARAVEPALHWPVSGFALVRSVTDPAGSRYEPIHWWNGAGRDG